jgi:hypothetical protein
MVYWKIIGFLFDHVDQYINLNYIRGMKTLTRNAYD